MVMIYVERIVHIMMIQLTILSKYDLHRRRFPPQLLKTKCPVKHLQRKIFKSRFTYAFRTRTLPETVMLLKIQNSSSLCPPTVERGATGTVLSGYCTILILSRLLP